MPPKKNVVKTVNLNKRGPEKKAPRQRAKQIKPPLKTPTIIKLKIPVKDLVANKNVKCVPVNCMKLVEDIRPKEAKLLTPDRKVELANRVARAQLVKDVSYEDVPTPIPSNVPSTDPAQQQNRRRITRKKPTVNSDTSAGTSMKNTEVARNQLVKDVSYEEVPTQTPSNVPSTEPAQQQKRRRGPRKKSTANSDTSPKTSNNNTEVAVQPAKKAVSQEAVTPAPNNTPSTESNTQKRKRGPQKKTTPNADITPRISVTDSEEAFDMTPKKRKNVRKPPAEVQKQYKPDLNTNNVVASTSSPLSLKKNLKKTKITNLETGITLTPVKTRENIKKSTVKKTPMTEPTRRTRRVVLTKGKRMSETSRDVKISPSIVDSIGSPKNKEAASSPVKTDLEVVSCAIESRKTSTTGISDCLSWTKDISSSSTTTCVTVCSNEFVRIDKKLPILKLTNIDYELKNATVKKKKELLSSSSGSESTEFTPKTPDREPSPDLESQSLGLSSSSITTDSPKTSVRDNGISEISRALNKLSSKLKNFDLEIINWIGYDNSEVNVKVNNFQQKIFNVLKEESKVIVHCQNIKRVLSDNTNDDVEYYYKNTEDEQDINENAFVIPDNSCRKSISEELNQDNKHKQSVSPTLPAKESSDDIDNNFTLDKIKITAFDQSCDDDDALSLFAESITGIDSSRLNSSVAPCNMDAIDYEEYVPLPVKGTLEPSKKIAYVPSKIHNEKQNNEVKTKIVCEKQNADSTSIYRKTEQVKSCDTVDFANSDHVAETGSAIMDSSQIKNISIQKKTHPSLMSLRYRPLHGTKSNLFKGICFFNLISSCKSMRCRYPHIILDINELASRIVRLSEEVFIQEYMLLRNWPELRRRYGMSFIEECKRRELTEILVEMALDFVMKTNNNFRDDVTLKVEAIESVLLYLNTVDLETCEYLLLHNIQKGSLLCDVFMQSIANTQNFSRFKPVFINLTNFIVRHDRTFNLNVATQILERLCILPCERALSEALLQIVKHTDKSILDSSMMAYFEKQLSGLCLELHAQFLELKKEASVSRPVVQSIFESSPRANLEIEPVLNTTLMHTEREKRYTSPDTTNVDNLKAVEEPIITRTIDFNRARSGNIQRSFSNSNCSTSNDSEEFRSHLVSTPNPNYKSWNRMSVFNKIRGYSQMPGYTQMRGRPPVRTLKRRIHHQNNFGHSPSKYRRSVPDFF